MKHALCRRTTHRIGWHLACWLVLSMVLSQAVRATEDDWKPSNDGKATKSESDLEFPADITTTEAIDLAVAARWKADAVQPAARCDDETFVRRVYLDVIGRIPTRAERQTFLADDATDKRDRLIETLVASDEHARHFADLFDAILMGRPSGRRADRWIQGREEHGWRAYLEESFRTNRPWNQMARDMVLARDTESTDVRAGWYLYERNDQHQDIAEAVAPHFFGIRIECAQCHDHPLASEIQQFHYWGLVAFFNRGKNENSAAGPRVAESATGGFQKFTDLAGDSYDADLTFFESATVAEERHPDDYEEQESDYREGSGDNPRIPVFSRREQFANQVLADHPLVARATVNRLWALLLGRGFVHPHDRMDSMHPASHPELLEWLSEDFRRSGYDIRRLVTSILRSRCYQLETSPTENGVLPEHFAYAITKPLNAEALLRSTLIVTTGELTEPSTEMLAAFRTTFPDVLPEEPTTDLSDALLLTNNEAYNNLLRGDRAASLQRLVDESPGLADRVDGAFELALGRLPDDAERARGVSFLQSHTDQTFATSQLIWALLTSAEFRLNH